MSILQTGRKSSGSRSVGRHGAKKNLSLVMLTFQNSALILVMHYSRVMPPSGDHRYFTSTAVFLNELVKLVISLTLAILEASKTLAPNTPVTTMFEQIYNAVFSGDGWKLTFPAALYTVQNLLQYAAVGNLDPVHFQVLYQIKILTTAIFSVCLLRRHLGCKSWLSLIILTFGVSVVSFPSRNSALDDLLLHGIPNHYFPRSKHELGQAVDAGSPDVHLTKRSATYEGIANDLPSPEPLMNYSVGVTAAVVSAVVSGLAAVYFERILKDSPTQASLWIRNIQLSFYSLIAALFGGVIWQDGSGIRQHGFFEGYNWIVWAAVLSQAAGGLISSLVIRDADSIAKNFATSISIVLSFVVSVLVFELKVTLPFLIGTSLVLFATYLYSVPEHSLHAPPLLIANFEKPAIERSLTPGIMARTNNPELLQSDPFDSKAVALSTSRPSSPKLRAR
ncbi:putative UDP-galactose transporter [Drechmeria coniospora]|uniref:Putative UDP-galactose transporter n=1 Tax=Drechmeria coniospora TaxID=98403 RepID=A0A151GVK4_DRECN|nr:putative UDP-galactose transporter [Drechmeria coniospora]KYK61128.1 putative UDP-galactose transporter [Drechmeria coniospora]ODA80894.1 hypothetical protein RJ55_03854 [Drechmeria coniospora]